LAGSGEKNRAAAAFAIDPNIASKSIVVPIGATCADEYGIPVRGHLNRADTYAVEEFVQRDLRLLLSPAKD
jgi:hypothetical protein